MCAHFVRTDNRDVLTLAIPETVGWVDGPGTETLAQFCFTAWGESGASDPDFIRRFTICFGPHLMPKSR
jgi:hypothetical protein